MSLITSQLADYAEQRGYLAPRIGTVYSATRGCWHSTDLTGRPATTDNAARLAAAGHRRVEIRFDCGTSVDFAVSELLPRTGIRAHAEVRDASTLELRAE